MGSGRAARIPSSVSSELSLTPTQVAAQSPPRCPAPSLAPPRAPAPTRAPTLAPAPARALALSLSRSLAISLQVLLLQLLSVWQRQLSEPKPPLRLGRGFFFFLFSRFSLPF
ncbi:hypothetical protein TIFTF001_031765 [Ficus carica]|uniref:Uncharacterized protein n=1 Tax=Ficus carica TaxID=3494 RepID=A0AA88J1I6_FICCA|nr:hypothetical protein TIFTF001_031765 [Ficus carica]